VTAAPLGVAPLPRLLACRPARPGPARGATALCRVPRPACCLCAARPHGGGQGAGAVGIAGASQWRRCTRAARSREGSAERWQRRALLAECCSLPGALTSHCVLTHQVPHRPSMTVLFHSSCPSKQAATQMHVCLCPSCAKLLQVNLVSPESNVDVRYASSTLHSHPLFWAIFAHGA
jgi:hypothetical protein